MNKPHTPSHPLINGRYHALSVLGRGGMGKVELVEDRFTGNRRVALKRLSAQLIKPLYRQQFRREFLALASLRHPNLAEVFEFSRDRESGESFYTSEYVQGENLLEYAKKATPAQIAQLVAKICIPLDYMHRRGFLHNDLKPSNVLILKATQEIKLLDFGLVSFFQKKANSEKGKPLGGTPLYMAPEVILGETPTPASDLYSLGMLLFRLLVPEFPIKGETSSQIFRMHLEHTVPLPRKVNPKIPHQLEKIILCFLERQPEKRYASAWHAYEALCEFAQIDLAKRQKPQHFIGRAGFIDREDAFHAALDFLLNEASPFSERIHLEKTIFNPNPAAAKKTAMLFMIKGRQGVGKSRFLRELQVFFQTHEIPAFLFLGNSHKGAYSFWINTANSIQGELNSGDELSKIFSHTEKQEELEMGEERNREAQIQDQLSKILFATAHRNPFIILIDDLPQLDSESLRALHYLIRAAGQKNTPGALRIFATAPESIAAALIPLLQEDHGIEQLLLPAFTQAVSREFILKSTGMEEISDALIERLHSVTEGNPLYLEEILHQIIEIQGLSPSRLSHCDPQTIPIPPTLQETLRLRLRTLPSDEIAVLEIAALLTQNFSAELPARVLSQDTQVLRAVLFSLHEQGMLLPAEDGTWRLHSALISEVLSKQMEDKKRQTLHHQIARTLVENFPETKAEVLAHHFMAAKETAQACEYLWQAAQENRKLGALSLARIQLLQVVDLTQLLQTPLHLQARRELGEVAYVLGQYAEVEKLYVPLEAELAKQKSSEELVCVLRVRGKIAQTQGKGIDARKLYEQALEILKKHQSSLHAKLLQADLLALLAHSFSQEGNTEQALPYMDQAISLLPRALKASPHREVGTVLILAGAIQGRAGLAKKSLHYWNLAKSHFRHNHDLQGEAMVENNFGLFYTEQGEHKKAASHYARALEISTQTGDVKRLGRTSLQLGNLAFLDEHPERARHFYFEAMRCAALLADSGLQALALTNLAFSEYELGLYGEAIEHHQQALLLKEKIDNARDLAHSYHGLAHTFIAIGSLTQAEEAFAKARGHWKGKTHNSFTFALGIREVALLIAQKDWSKANALLDDLSKMANLGTNEKAQIALAQVEIFLARKNPEKARSLLDQYFPQGQRQDEKRFLFPEWLALHGELLFLEEDKQGLRDFQKHLTKISSSQRFCSQEIYGRLLLLRCKFELFEKRDEFAHATLQELLAIDKKAEAGLPESYRQIFRNRPFRLQIDSLQNSLGSKKIPHAFREQALERLLQILAKTKQPGIGRKEILYAILDELLILTRAERAFLFLSRDYPSYVVEVARETNKQSIHHADKKISHSIVQQVLKSGHHISSMDVATDPKIKAGESILDLKLHTVLCVPVRGEKQILGVLYLDHAKQRGIFTDDSLHLARLLADHIASVIEQVDQLSGLRNQLEQTQTELSDLRSSLDFSTRPLSGKYDFSPLIGQSRPMRGLLQMLERVVPTDTTILIEGESGTGKELLAQTIHANGPRSEKPFITVNCGGMTPTLLESQLFGHVTGAFTGAVSDQKGFFEAAHGGTMFLDEIADLSLDAQAKLLRALQEGEIQPLGATTPKRIDVRVIAASSRDLLQAVKGGTFREDLYYRIHVIRLRLPPLRRREGDLELLLAHFLQEAKGKGRPKKLTTQARRAVLHHRWPGNVRELKHAVESMVLMAKGSKITLADLPESMGARVGENRDPLFVNLRLHEARKEFTKQYLHTLYLQSKGNIAEVARRSGMHRVSLYRWFRRFLPELESQGRRKKLQ